ncbi:hypothetical protein BJ138DRAFT_1053698 [Hygrophoropsis aurantiaca]|uniref:Uncharacterized protein n=1 Tax=Hygrophoropsis aurantiaca TaxID=72124 RepID=A0ACB8AUJ8_9AGAM|nr:hypothetical protein BJ138DRAFT_1053698 [Hygrophoropsis aurantiaca]
MASGSTDSPHSETSDSDAVNSANARVYFGPLQSPEKKFLTQDIARRTLHLVGGSSPPRRSPRFSAYSSPSPQQHGQDNPVDVSDSDEDAAEIDEVTAHLSRGGTPDNDPLPQDEPSSVLASRIMRAHDNPSPPPRQQNDLDSHDSLVNRRFPLMDAYPPPSPFRSINLHERLNQLSAPASEYSLQPRQAPPTLDGAFVDSPNNRSQQDLMSFDSIPTSEEISTPQDFSDMSESHIPTAKGSMHTTVDDLLSQSPAHVSSIERAATPSDQQGTSSVHEVTNQRIIMEVGLDDTSAATSSNAQAPSSSSSIPVPPATPIRRSPRQSRQPHNVQVGHATNNSGTTHSKGKGKATHATPGAINDVQPLEEAQLTRQSSAESDETIPGVVGRKSRRKNSGRRVPPGSQRELGSLSPESASVLARLVPTTQSTAPTTTPSPSIPHTEIERTQTSTPQKASTSNISHPNLLKATIQRPPVPLTPMRLTANFRNPSSPLKFSFTVEDTARTPARRVPIVNAIPSSILSSQKTAQLSARGDNIGQLGLGRTPVFTRPALDVPSRSPAKRIPVPEFMSSLKSTSMNSPSRLIPRARSASVEPAPTKPLPVRSQSVDPTQNAESKGKNFLFAKPSATIPRPGSNLPFPLVPGQTSGSGLPHSIPEESEVPDAMPGPSTATTSRNLPASSPMKSNLKQPSAGSRIPRIGVKPYARPVAKNGKGKEVSTTAKPQPTLALILIDIFQKPSSQLVHAGGGSSSDEFPSTLLSNKKGTSESTTLATLKRKRGTESVTSPPGIQPMMVRQVLPGMLGGKYAVKPSSMPETHEAMPSQSSPQKTAGPMGMRKVVDGMFAGHYGAPRDAKAKLAEEVDKEGIPTPSDDLKPSVNAEDSRPQESPIHDTAMSSPVPNEGSEENEGELRKSSPPREVTESSSQTRRPARTRKTAPRPVADVFGATTRQVQPRRKPPVSRSDGDGFQGMSAVALKALTNSNTTKNQQFLVKIETEIIRKDGVRPESPTTKVRTILQKQREERDKQRQERAERRARRSEDGPNLSDTEGMSEFGDHSFLGHDENDSPRDKYRRGPGDDEDYETPEKHERPIKRLRFGEGSEEETGEKKRVKWHRGLSTTIYLDELHPKPKARPKDLVIGKGCLAPAIKHIQLDTLGNMPDAPLNNLVQENIVVKKFVYDNDIEPEVVAPAKATRSRSKKAKS